MREFIIEDHPDQQFSLILERRRVTMRLAYNQVSERWSFDLSMDDLPILHGRRIVTGTDLLKPFDLGIGVIFAAPVIDGAVPDRVQLANGSVKIFQTTDEEIESAIVSIVEEPQTPNVRPIIWTAPEPTYFGQPYQVGRLLDEVEEGFAVDFLNSEVLIRSNDDPALNFIGTFADAISTGKFEYGRTSDAWLYDQAGLLIPAGGNDILRIQRDPLTGDQIGALFEPARQNRVPSSGVAAIGGGITINANVAVAPDGTTTADEIVETAANAEHYSEFTVPDATIGQQITFSTYVKATLNPRILRFQFYGGVSANTFFDVSNGNWYANGSGWTSRGFEVLPNGWFRVWVTVTVTVTGPTTQYARVQLADASMTTVYPGDDVSGLYIWGKQFEMGDSPTMLIPTDGVVSTRNLDDFKIPLASIPWHDGAGDFLINEIKVVPNVVADKIVFPTSGEPIRTFRYRIV